MVERGYLTKARPEVFVINGSPPTWRQQLMIATLTRDGLPLAVGKSAARLHGLDGCRFDALQIAVPRGARRLADVEVFQTLVSYAPMDVVTIDGIRCSGLARTVVDLAWLDPGRYVRAVDDFERRGCSLSWLEQTARRLRARGREGSGLVAADLAQRAGGGQRAGLLVRAHG